MDNVSYHVIRCRSISMDLIPRSVSFDQTDVDSDCNRPDGLLTTEAGLQLSNNAVNLRVEIIESV